MHVNGLLARPALQETASRGRRWAARRTLIFACCALSLRLVPGLALPMAAAAHRSQSSRDGGSSDYEAGAVPSYMLDLYQRYVSGALPLDGSNTVHCIHATRSRTGSGGSDALEFDLETIGGSEALVRAELRLSDGRARARDPAAAAASAEQPLVLSMRGARWRTDSQAEATAASASLPGGLEEAAELPRPLWTATLAPTPIALRSRGFGGGWVNVGGWRMIEVTHPIKRALLSAAGKIELLVAYTAAAVDESSSAEPEAGKSVGITEARTGEDGRSSRDGNNSSRGLDLLVSRHGLPYLLVYTNDTVNLTADQISSRLRLRDSDNIRQEADSLVNPETGLLGGEDWSTAAVARRKRPPAAAAHSSLSSSSAAPLFSSAAIESWWHVGKPIRRLPKRILRREVADDNEIPGDPDVARRLRLPQQSSIASQQLRHPRPAVPAKTPATNLGDVLLPRSQGGFRSLAAKPQRTGSSGQLIPWPKESDKLPVYARRPQSGSKQDGAAGGVRSASGGRRTERQRQKQLKQTSRAAGVPAASSGASCGRKRLTLDFEDVGWGGWIIEPKSFDIHYCAGACEFPLNSAQQPTNHATIQSLLRAAGVRPDLPAPCCVPDKLSSVTLLYFDQRRNVVLKSYPGMTVESCACR